MNGFHEVRLPLRLAFGSGAGIERRTDIVTLNSGFEQRISPWPLGRRHYVIGAGIKSLADAAALLEFFEARHGQLYGFRFKDFSDYKSCALDATITAFDQTLAIGNGITKSFFLTKAYGDVIRPIHKPIRQSVQLSLDDVQIQNGFGVNDVTGEISFTQAPQDGVVIKAGFEFDTPVRFDSDRLDLTLEGFSAGRVAAIGLSELRL